MQKRIHTSSKLLCKFNVKDKTPFEEQHDLPYKAVCATQNCTEDYVGETAWCIVERAKDNKCWDQHSHLVKYPIDNNYLPVVKGDFTILDSGYRNNTCKGKIVEGLMTKVGRLSLNVKEKSVELKLFNWKSALNTNVYSRSILEKLHSVWDLSKLDNSDNTFFSSEILVYSCLVVMTMSVKIFIIL